MAREFKVGGTRPSSIKVGTSVVNLVKFSNEGYVWAKPLTMACYINDSGIKNVSISRSGVCGDSASSTLTASSNTLAGWLRYNDNLTFAATLADPKNKRETRTINGAKTETVDVTDSQTLTTPTSDSRTVTEQIDTGYQTVYKRTDRDTQTTGWNVYENSSRIYDNRNAVASTYTVYFHGNGSNYQHGQPAAKQGNIYQPQSRTIATQRYYYHTSYQERYRTVDSNQSRPKYINYYQSRSGTIYTYQSRSGKRMDTYSRKVYQERTKTTTYSMDTWDGDLATSSSTASLTGITKDIAVSVNSTSSDSYTSWADYDYGSWTLTGQTTDWGEWKTDSTRTDWGDWVTNSTEEWWGDWTEYSETVHDWGGWSEYSGSDGSWSGWYDVGSPGDWWNNGSQWNETISLAGAYVRFFYHFDYWSMGSTSGAAIPAGGSYSGGTTTAYAHWSEDEWIHNSTELLYTEDSTTGEIDGLTLYVRNRKSSGGDWYNTMIPMEVTIYSSNGTQVGYVVPQSKPRIFGGKSEFIYYWNQSYNTAWGSYAKLMYYYTNGSGWSPSSNECFIPMTLS